MQWLPVLSSVFWTSPSKVLTRRRSLNNWDLTRRFASERSRRHCQMGRALRVRTRHMRVFYVSIISADATAERALSAPRNLPPFRGFNADECTYFSARSRRMGNDGLKMVCLRWRRGAGQKPHRYQNEATLKNIWIRDFNCIYFIELIKGKV